MRIEFYFDFSCPYAYLGYTQIEALAARHGAELVWKPMLLGGVFRAVATSQNLALSQPAAKTHHGALDMQRWARFFDVELHMPAAHPMRTVEALRALLAVDEPFWPALIDALFRAYWVESMDIGAPETLVWALRRAAVPEPMAQAAMSAGENQGIREELARRTEEAIARGVFGAPAIFVSGPDLEEPIMFWGQDRLAMTEAVLLGWRPGDNAPAARAAVPTRTAPGPIIDFWYDFASPFAYLGFTQIQALADRMSAKLRYRPILLGALFKNLGTPNVPLLAMSDAKRRYYARELEMWSSYWQVPFQFTSTFPLRTVSALRLALQAGERIAELTGLLFRAAWVDNRDISDEGLLREILLEAGFDADAMLAGCADPSIKDMLFENTKEAQGLGVFGVPTMTVSDAGSTELFWGQDRLDLMEWWLQKNH